MFIIVGKQLITEVSPLSIKLYACIEGEIYNSKIKLSLLFSYTSLMFFYVVIAFAQAYSYQGLSIHPIFALTYGYSTLTSQTNNKAIWSEATNKHSTPYQRTTLHCAALIYHSYYSLYVIELLSYYRKATGSMRSASTEGRLSRDVSDFSFYRFVSREILKDFLLFALLK